MLGVDAPTIAARMVNVPALGDKFPRDFFVDIPMSIDGGVVTLAGNLFDTVAIPHGSWPDHALTGIQINTFKARAKFKLHDHIVSRRYS